MKTNTLINHTTMLIAVFTVAAAASAQGHVPSFTDKYNVALKGGDLKTATNLLQAELIAVDVDVLKGYMKSGDEKGFGDFAQNLVKSSFDSNDLALDQVAWLIACPDTQTNDTQLGAKAGGGYSATGIPEISPNFHRDRFLPLAQKAIDQAIALTHKRGDAYLDTLAWVQYSRGNAKDAAKTEAEASHNSQWPQYQQFYGDIAKWFAKQPQKSDK